MCISQWSILLVYIKITYFVDGESIMFDFHVCDNDRRQKKKNDLASQS